MTVFIQFRNYSQASCTDDLRVKIVTMSFKNLSGSCRVLSHTGWLNILITFGFPSKKVYEAFMLVFFLSAVGTAHRLCSWCHRNAQCGRCQYYRVYRGLLCLCEVVLCPITSHPCNKQVGSWENELFTGPSASYFALWFEQSRVSTWNSQASGLFIGCLFQISNCRCFALIFHIQII